MNVHYLHAFTGNYVYVESSHRTKAETARLMSKILTFSTPQCLSFYYNMYGEAIGTLTLWMAQEGKPRVKLFEKSGNQGPYWQNADVTLNYKGKFQVRLSSVCFLRKAWGCQIDCEDFVTGRPVAVRLWYKGQFTRAILPAIRVADLWNLMKL